MPPQTLVAKGSLDDMFARLSAATPFVPSRPAIELSPAGPDKSMLSFDNCSETITATTKVFGSASSEEQGQPCPAPALPDTGRLQGQPTHAQSSSKTQQTPSIATWQCEPQDECEGEYLRKAAAYFSTLPTRPGDSAHIIKVVATKLHAAYVSNVTELQTEEVERLRARYIFAVTNYANKKVKLNPEPLTADFVKKVLRNSNGDFLQLCAALVKDKYIALESLKQVTDLCQNVLDVLPKADNSSAIRLLDIPTVDENTRSAASTAPVANTSKKASGDPLEGMKAWPTQEKREHGMSQNSVLFNAMSFGLQLYATTASSSNVMQVPSTEPASLRASAGSSH